MNAEFGKIKTETDDINSNLTWKLLSSTTGTTAITIPTNLKINELFIMSGVDERQISSIQIPYVALPETYKTFYFPGGYQYVNSGNYSYVLCRVIISKTSLYLQINAIDNTDYTSQTVTEVYYR